MLRFIFLTCLTILLINAQKQIIKGKVSNKITGEALPFANIRIDNTNLGTSSNINGEFIFSLENENHKIIASYIGYYSDTLNIYPGQNNFMEFQLTPATIELGTITIKPGTNPAIEIINKSIKKKQIQKKLLNTYQYHSYSKLTARSNREISLGYGGFNLNLSKENLNRSKDTLAIAGILENETISYYSKPDYHKDVIISRKQTANISASANVMTGNIITNFYNEKSNFDNIELLSPIADHATEYYYYILSDSLFYEKSLVYKIDFEPINEYNPGFKGHLYIAKEDYSLIKIECSRNKAANPGGMYTDTKHIQEFVNYDNFYLPIYYRAIAKANVFGVKAEYDITTIMKEYKINNPLSENLFDDVIVKVSSEADLKDSLYWENNSLIEVKKEDIFAYNNFDSLQTTNLNKNPEFNIFSPQLYITKWLSINSLPHIYSFNRTEGHTLNLGIKINNLPEENLYLNAEINYGFSDRKLKQALSIFYFFNKNDKEAGNISVRLNNSLTTLFNSSIDYKPVVSLMNSFFNKYDERSYFYRYGIDIDFKLRLNYNLRINIGYSLFKDKSAQVNSQFSLFNVKENYNPVKSISESTFSLITIGFNYNLNKYKFIDDSGTRTALRINQNQFIISAEIVKALNNNGFLKYNFGFKSDIRCFGNTSLSANAIISFSNIYLPIQFLNALEGRMMGISKNNTFRTIEAGTAYGEESAALNLTYNLQDELFKVTGLNLLRQWEILMYCYFNIGYISNSDNNINNEISLYNYKKPLMESGFGLGHRLLPMSLEFTWRLNYLKEKTFQFTINIPLL